MRFKTRAEGGERAAVTCERCDHCDGLFHRRAAASGNVLSRCPRLFRKWPRIFIVLSTEIGMRSQKLSILFY